MAKPVSINDDISEVIKLRKDQYYKIAELIQSSENPQIALERVKNITKSWSNVLSVRLNSQIEPTHIECFTKDTQYSFKLSKFYIAQKPTL